MKKTKVVVFGAIMTALVIVLQFMGSFIRFGPFSISLVLIPIVLGTSICGEKIGAWLGLVFGMVVLASGDAGAFLSVNAAGTVIVVILKGILCGYLAGIAYKAFEKRNTYLAVVAAAVVCPVVNTGVFLIGCRLFFMAQITEWAMSFGFGENVVAYMFLGLAGGNFLLEFLLNILISPVVVRLLNIEKRQN